jgi:hypothetical protein
VRLVPANLATSLGGTPAEREEYVAWWLYESGLDVDELIEIAFGLALAV